MINILFFVGLCLLIFSFIDLFNRKIFSFLLTTPLLVVLWLNHNLLSTIVAGLFALILFELDFFKGIADIKVTALIGSVIEFNTFNFTIFFSLIGCVGLIYLSSWKYILKGKDDEIPFIPCLLVIFIILILGGII